MTTQEPPAEVSKRNLPLRLCEVLEKEFVAIRGHPPSPASWFLEQGHIDETQLTELLLRPSQCTYPDAILAVRTKLELKGVSLPIDRKADTAREPYLLQALNESLADHESLYDHHLIDRNSDAWLLAEVVSNAAAPRQASASQSPSEVADRTATPDHVLMNRLLLEAAFPVTAVARADTVRLNRLFAHIHALRGPDSIYSALCLSGGGIRSASFALGALQALARCGILDKFDYLSTVSGGGYIGSWLSTWIHRHPQGLPGVISELSAHAQPETGNLTRVLRPESGAIRFLRSYSHFLNPKAGLFSADTWSWIGIYLRNLSLNWLAIIPLMLIAVAVPRLYAAMLYDSELARGELLPWLVWTATLAAFLTLICVTVNRPSISDAIQPERVAAGQVVTSRVHRFLGRFTRESWVLAFGLAPIAIFAFLLTLIFWGFRGKTPFSMDLIRHWLPQVPWSELPIVLPLIGVEHLVLWGELIVLASWLISSLLLPGRDWSKRGQELVAMLVAGLLTWGVLGGLADYAVQMSSTREAVFEIGSIAIYPAHLFAVLGFPVLMIAVLAGMTIFIGGVSKFRWIEDEDREWWARFGAWVLIVMVAWIALSAVTILGPPLLLEFPKVVASVGGVSGLLAVLLGKSSLTSAAGQPGSATQARPQGIFSMFGLSTLAAAAVVFFAAFLAFLSLLTNVALESVLKSLAAPVSVGEGLLPTLTNYFRPTREFAHACGLGDPWSWSTVGFMPDPQSQLEIVCQTPLTIVTALVVALAIVLIVASLLINLNKFSLHAAYRIRIVRTFLGASRRGDRHPNPFTGFDPLDNVQMHELQPGLLRDADIIDLRRLVEILRQALLGRPGAASASPALAIVRRMCNSKNDPSGVLESRLRHSESERPILKAVQRDLLEALNRVLQTTQLHRLAEFSALAHGGNPGKYRDAVEQYVAHGNIIFANRLLLEAAFPDIIKPYDFPPPPPHKLIHVINLTLNLVHGRRLAWQERKAAPFSVTPMHAGSYYLGYRETRDYGGRDGISIGTATAISGAAVSPNMGYSSSPITALLLTLFNVRLGWWLGNPGIAGNDTYTLAEPRFSLRPLLAEALGLTDDRSPYVYLSDGGHFENMGLFEMVLRRCRLIVVTDAGADPEYQFDDLGNAVRKIRIDLGVPIDFPSMPICKRSEASDEHGRYCALGRIRYSIVDGPAAPDGILVCIKPALYGREPQDVLNYAAQKKPFPQEPTFDQFFSESQFESYRHLGEFETTTICGNELETGSGKPFWSAALIAAVRRYLGYEQEQWIDDWFNGLTDMSQAGVSSTMEAAKPDIAAGPDAAGIGPG